MVPANKILTVAYGTFSCTLEGFDDPFSTMTDIAEYFRDLAADDRFFGAEPPTPDMAMLRTIAEARAKHAVTAQPEEGGVTLRPTEMPAAAAITAAFVAADTTAPASEQFAAGVAAEMASDKEQDEIEAQHVEAPAEPEAAAEIDASQDEANQDDTEIQSEAIPESEMASAEDEVEADVDATQADDSVAAKLARIRGVVEADRQAASTYAEDEHADDMMIEPTDMADDTLAAAFEADALDDEIDAEDVAIEIDVADAAPITEESEDTLTADLAAILSPQATAPTDETPVEVAEMAVAAPVDTAQADDEVDEANTDEEEAISPRQQRRIRVRRVRRVQAAAEAAGAAAQVEETLEEADPEIIEEEAAEAQTPDASVERPTEDEVSSEDSAEIETVADAEDDASDDDELMAELAAIEAELTRDTRGETAIDVSDTETADLDDEDDLMAELAAIRAEDVTDEDESDFENEDAAIVAGIMDDDEDDLAGEMSIEDTQDEDAPAETTEITTGEAVELATSAEDDETASVPPAPDMERLFAATDSRLSGEDTSRRHANISHLKAAVAARRADGPVEAKDVTETDAYRADLASTVRPRRKVASTEEAPRTPRPERPAPLVLVSEQRVEASLPADATPVQPRRTTRTAEIETQEEALSGAEDFEAFAADVGASDLADILEAAAVYSSKIMGQDNFSRPRLLHLAAEAVEDMSREDGLRGFGQLLRDGTIRKVSRGTFALATDSRYAEEADRRVG